jgi:hypothetical protein
MPIKFPMGEDLVPLRAVDVSDIGRLYPDGVPDPIFILKRNKVRCPRCGKDSKTRAKYIAHYQRARDH